MDDLVAMLPVDGSFIPKGRLVKRLEGLTGDPVEPARLGLALRRASVRGWVRVGEDSSKKVGEGQRMIVARGWPKAVRA